MFAALVNTHPAQACEYPTLLFESKPPGDTENKQVIMRSDLALVLARLSLFEFQLPNDRRFRPTPLHPVAERLQMAFVILPVEREVVRVGESEGERHRVLFHFRQQFQHPPTRSRGELDNFTTRAATARVSCRHIPTEADLDQAGPTVTGDASLSLSRRNMRFRQAQRRRGGAVAATPPPLAVASCHRVRPQNRRAVVLAVRFCSFYFADVL